MDGTASATPGQKAALIIFAILLSFRIVRILGNAIGYFVYRPAKLLAEPTFNGGDCSVILPVTHPTDPDLEKCVFSVLENFPNQLYIVAVGERYRDYLDRRLGHLRYAFPATQINIGAVHKNNKRRQISHGINQVSTRITVIVDDRVYWPKGFLRSALAPFEKGLVAGITVPRRVRKPSSGDAWDSFWACLASFYYAHLDHENQCVNALDSSAMLGAATGLYRSYIIMQKSFLEEFEGERCFFGRYGPLKKDEHQFFNQYLLQHSDLLSAQSTADTTVEVPLGSHSEFIADCQRWIRSTWRLNTSMLCFKECWRFPWAVYATWLSGLFSFTLLFDVIVIVVFLFTQLFAEHWAHVFVVLGLIMFMKLIHTLPPWLRMVRMPFSLATMLLCSLFLLPAQYLLCLLKIKTLLTYWYAERAECEKTDVEQGRGNKEPSWIWGDVQLPHLGRR
ncbi:hypothetical protein FDECE_17487 [Fusarium decemcellulare]|nr:hypothetical protein FDECE_17487 [Fusarium decemcellulare]